jgi:hypothetical protein
MRPPATAPISVLFKVISMLPFVARRLERSAPHDPRDRWPQ